MKALSVLSVWEGARKGVKCFPVHWALEGMLQDIHWGQVFQK